MERIFDVLPIILLGIGQLANSIVIINLSKRLKYQENHDTRMESMCKHLFEVKYGKQE